MERSLKDRFQFTYHLFLMPRKSTLSLTVSEESKDRLRDMAIEFGYQWGDEPNISALVEAIGNGELYLGLEPPEPDDAAARSVARRLRHSLHRAIAEIEKIEQG